MAILANVGLRAVTMASRFVLLFALARYLSAADVGRYGLVVATVSYGVMLLGLDFYTYSTRELLQESKLSRYAILRAQALLHVATYVAALPFGLLLFWFGLLPWTLAGWFFSLAVLEHLAKELNRLLIVLGRPIFATAALFVQRGAWAVTLPALMYYFESIRTLDAVFVAWTASTLLGIVTFLYGLAGLGWGRGGTGVDWSWLRRGLAVSRVFLAGTLLRHALFTVDRYVLEQVAGLDIVGVYTFFMAIAMAAMTFLDAGVFAFLYPKVVSSYRTGDRSTFIANMQTLARRTVVATAVLIIGAALAIHPLLDLLQRPLYTANVGIFWVLSVAVVFHALGMVPHFGLYAMGLDRSILLSRLAGFLVFALTIFPLAAGWPRVGVAGALVAGLATIATLNGVMYLAARPSGTRLATR